MKFLCSFILLLCSVIAGILQVRGCPTEGGAVGGNIGTAVGTQIGSQIGAGAGPIGTKIGTAIGSGIGSGIGGGLGSGIGGALHTVDGGQGKASDDTRKIFAKVGQAVGADGSANVTGRG